MPHITIQTKAVFVTWFFCQSTRDATCYSVGGLKEMMQKSSSLLTADNIFGWFLISQLQCKHSGRALSKASGGWKKNLSGWFFFMFWVSLTLWRAEDRLQAVIPTGRSVGMWLQLCKVPTLTYNCKERKKERKKEKVFWRYMHRYRKRERARFTFWEFFSVTRSTRERKKEKAARKQTRNYTKSTGYDKI